MFRYAATLTLLLFAVVLSACQLDAEQVGDSALRPTDTPVPAPVVTQAPTVAIVPTETLTPTPSPTPTNTPTPTATPLPSNRLKTARQAYDSGDYKTARTEFDSLLNDPGASEHERRLALHWLGRSQLMLGDTLAAIDTLQQFLKQYPGDELARVAQFNMGLAYEQSGRNQEAINTYLGVIIPDDPANVYIYEMIGDLYLSSGAYTETITAYQHGIDSTDDVSFKVHLTEGIAQTELLNADNPDAAIEQYESTLEIAQIPAYRAKILRLLGDAYAAKGDTEAAQASYQEAIDNYPDTPDSYLALVELVNADVPVDDYQRGVVDYYAQAYQPAILAFERYLSQLDAPAGESTEAITNTTTLTATGTNTQTTIAPTPQPTPLPNVDEALWLLGLSRRILGQYNAAIFAFQKLIDDHPNSPHWDDAHVLMGRTLIDQENYSRGKAVLRDFAAKNPNSPVADDALWRAARLDLDSDLLEEGQKNMRALADTFPSSDYAGDALYWAGQAAFMQENYEDAIENWTLLAENYPTSDLVSFAGYWRARALRQLGQETEAEQVLMELTTSGVYDYYNLRARDVLTSTSWLAEKIAVPDVDQLAAEQAEAEAWLREWVNLEGVENPAAIGDTLQNDSAFQRGDALLKLGLRDKALVEFETVRERYKEEPDVLYQLAVYFNSHQLGKLTILTSGRLIYLSPAEDTSHSPIFIERMFYPFYYEDIVFREAENLEIDPALVVSLIRQESLFEKSAESIAGARGLMQVMPTTGEYVAERSDHGSFHIDDLWLPYINVKMGAWYINQQLGIFEGNQLAAMAAYNAGPGNVLDWIEVSDDLDIFVEAIPFWESRTYIRRVYENLAAYHRIYGSSE